MNSNGVSHNLIIDAENVHRTFGDGETAVRVLRGVNLQVETGDMIALYGPSGSGKTTLLNLIGALDRPTEGRISICGAEITAMPESKRTLMRRRHIGFIFQNYTLINTYTAAENIDLGLRLLLPRISHRERQQRTMNVLQVMGLSNWADHVPDQLSGGQRQRIAIARALSLRPDFILADEPASGLDTRTAQRVLALFQGIARSQGTAFLIVSHDPQVVNFVDRAYDLVEGQLVLRQGDSHKQVEEVHADE
jgi:putative ABC transport system ATP-binding protein